MKIEMKVKKVNSDYVWSEKYDIENGSDPQKYAQNLVDNFNNTLRPNETARELVEVIIVDEESEVVHKHSWEKTNLVTIVDRCGSYDKVRCTRCGITGKRFGLGNVKVDSKYKSKCYETCEGAIKQFEKRKLKKVGNK